MKVQKVRNGSAETKRCRNESWISALIVALFDEKSHDSVKKNDKRKEEICVWRFRWILTFCRFPSLKYPNCSSSSFSMVFHRDLDSFPIGFLHFFF